jgi:hypothetical protein
VNTMTEANFDTMHMIDIQLAVEDGIDRIISDLQDYLDNNAGFEMDEVDRDNERLLKRWLDIKKKIPR